MLQTLFQVLYIPFQLLQLAHTINLTPIRNQKQVSAFMYHVMYSSRKGWWWRSELVMLFYTYGILHDPKAHEIFQKILEAGATFLYILAGRIPVLQFSVLIIAWPSWILYHQTDFHELNLPVQNGLMPLRSVGVSLGMEFIGNVFWRSLCHAIGNCCQTSSQRSEWKHKHASSAEKWIQIYLRHVRDLWEGGLQQIPWTGSTVEHFRLSDSLKCRSI